MSLLAPDQGLRKGKSVGIFIIKTKQAFSGRETTWSVKIMQLICYALNTWLKMVKEK